MRTCACHLECGADPGSDIAECVLATFLERELCSGLSRAMSVPVSSIHAVEGPPCGEEYASFGAFEESTERLLGVVVWALMARGGLVAEGEPLDPILPPLPPPFTPPLLPRLLLLLLPPPPPP